MTALHKFCQQLSFSVLEQIYPREVVTRLLSQDHAWEQRERKLNHLFLLYLLIVWSLSARSSLRAACDRLLRPLRLMGRMQERTPTAAALCYRRRHLGVRVLRHLFQACCRPFADAQAHPPGCFAFGLRLMGVDGTQFSVADSPANRASFPQPSASAFLKLTAVLLVEVGTHAIVDAIPALSQGGESRLAKGLLRSISEGMLVLADRGFYSAAWLSSLVQRGAHVLVRLASNRLLGTPTAILSDGSVLMTLTCKDDAHLGTPLTVRVISYRLLPEAAERLEQVTPSHSQHGSGTTNPKVHEVHRLVTTLLDPLLYPALELCLLYHERWEVELVIDELKDHQRIAQRPLSSKSPIGILQEFYALLLAHYALRILMGKAAHQASVEPDRLSFTHTIEVVTDALLVAACSPVACHADLSTRLLDDLSQRDWLLPERRLRFNSRVIKRSRSRFQIKRADHVFLSVKDFPFLKDHPHPTFRELLLI
jgi:hypothetical protein